MISNIILNNTLSSELLLTASLCLWTGIIGDSLINVKEFLGKYANSFEFVVYMPVFRGLVGVNSFSDFTFFSLCTFFITS